MSRRQADGEKIRGAGGGGVGDNAARCQESAAEAQVRMVREQILKLHTPRENSALALFAAGPEALQLPPLRSLEELPSLAVLRPSLDRALQLSSSSSPRGLSGPEVESSSCRSRALKISQISSAVPGFVQMWTTPHEQVRMTPRTCAGGYCVGSPGALLTSSNQFSAHYSSPSLASTSLPPMEARSPRFSPPSDRDPSSPQAFSEQVLPGQPSEHKQEKKPRKKTLRSSEFTAISSKGVSRGRGAIKDAGDPMAGGLFSRDAQIDYCSRTRGLYDAQLLGSRQLRRTLSK